MVGRSGRIAAKQNMVFFEEPGDAFSLITVLQMGQNYEQNTDGYVYIYSPNGSTEGTMNQLAVVPRAEGSHPRSQQRTSSSSPGDRMARPNGRPTWRPAAAVHTFPSGWVNTEVHPYAWHPSVVYNKPLGLYLMANWGMGCTPDGMWFGKPSYLGFWTAPHPWGPWTQIHEESEWTPGGDKNARAYQPQIAPKWIAADGKSFWLVWTDFPTGQRQAAVLLVQRSKG